MKKIILFFTLIFTISFFGYSQNRNFSTLGKWSIESKIDEYSGDTIKSLEYNSAEKVISSISKIQCAFNKNANTLRVFLLVDDITTHDYIWNSEYVKSGKVKYNYINHGKYRYTSGVDNFDEHELNTVILYSRIGEYTCESFEINDINLNEMTSKHYLNIKYEDKINNSNRIIKIPLVGFIVNYNKL